MNWLLASLLLSFGGISPKCRNCTQPAGQNLMVFISFSVPMESWKEWSVGMEKSGGTFVLRGLPDNSFQLFSKKVTELRKEGVKAPIVIDPEAYSKYGIEAVPAVVQLDGQKYDKMSGNIRLEEVLRRFAQAK